MISRVRMIILETIGQEGLVGFIQCLDDNTVESNHASTYRELRTFDILPRLAPSIMLRRTSLEGTLTFTAHPLPSLSYPDLGLSMPKPKIQVRDIVRLSPRTSKTRGIRTGYLSAYKKQQCRQRSI